MEQGMLTETLSVRPGISSECDGLTAFYFPVWIDGYRLFPMICRKVFPNP